MTDIDESFGKYGLVLPNDDTLTARFQGLVKYWRNRNKFILDMRAAVAGNNEIEAPETMQYKIKVVHAYMLATIINQKVSRYLRLPVIQVIPRENMQGGIDPDDRADASRTEKGLNVALTEIDRRSGGNVHDRLLFDTILLDGAVEKWLAAPNAFWTDIVTRDSLAEQRAEGQDIPEEYANLFDDDKLKPGSKARETYKLENGIPITRRYVPLEMSYPQYDGDTLIENFEVDERSLISVCNNKLFDNDYGGPLIDQIKQSLGRDGGVEETVNIIEYANNVYHAYYLGNKRENRRAWPKVNAESQVYTGRLQLLYKYEHGINRNPYNYWTGRYGGWTTSNNRIEGIGKGQMELSAAADDILSQAFTNVRAKYWPSLNFKLDPEKRGFGTDYSKAKAPTIKEGQEIVTFTGEEIAPIFKPEEDPMAMWTWDKISEQLGKMGGSPVLFGGRQPGVDTGYAQALQTTTAEDGDEKIAQHVNFSVTQGMLIMMLYVRKINEKIPMEYTDSITEPGKVGKKKVRKMVTLDPKDLSPMPRLDAQVTKPSPMDYMTALRAFQMATASNNGQPPAMSYDTARAELLAMLAPDDEKFKILIEAQENEIIESGVLSSKIGDMVNIKLAKNGVPEVSPEMMSKADPSLVASIQASAPQAAAGGGLDPRMLGAAAATNGIPANGPPAAAPTGGGTLPPGPLPGNPEPMNRIGEAAGMNAQTGAG